jgi:acyl dehydratase
VTAPVRPSLRIEDVAVGTDLPPLERTVTLTSLVMYAAATWDFHRFHYDQAFVQAHGFPAPFVDGQMVGALLGTLLMDWGGPEALLRRLSYRLRTMIHVGERVRCLGTVVGTAVEGDRHLALCRLSVVKGDGAEVVRDGHAAVELPSRPR